MASEQVVIRQASTMNKRPLALDPAILGRSREIGDAIWVALWAYDRATRQCVCRDGTLVGLVLGSSAITDQRIAAELKRSIKWVRRWRVRAVEVGLLRTRRFPYGNIIAVLLPGKKFLRHEVKDAPEWAQLPTPAKPKRTGRGKSRVPISGLSEVPKRAIQSAQIGVSEGTKMGSRRKTISLTAQPGLAQVTLPPSLNVPPQGELVHDAKNASVHLLSASPSKHKQGKRKPAFEARDKAESWRCIGLSGPHGETGLQVSWQNWWFEHRHESVPERAAGFLECVQRYGWQDRAGPRFLAALKVKAGEVGGA